MKFTMWTDNCNPITAQGTMGRMFIEDDRPLDWQVTMTQAVGPEMPATIAAAFLHDAMRALDLGTHIVQITTYDAAGNPTFEWFGNTGHYQSRNCVIRIQQAYEWGLTSAFKNIDRMYKALPLIHISRKDSGDDWKFVCAYTKHVDIVVNNNRYLFGL